MSTALIIVDPQNDFCEGGSLGVNESPQIFPVINNLRKDKRFSHIFISKDWHPQGHISFAATHNKDPFTDIMIGVKKQELWPVHCIQNSKGSELSALLETSETDIIVTKGEPINEDSYSAFGTENYPSKLLKELQAAKVQKAVVVGLAFDFCVGSTAIDSQKNNIDTYVIREGTRSVSKQTEKVMEERLMKGGVKVIGVADWKQ